MDEEFRSLTDRLGDEAGGSEDFRRLLATEDAEELALVLVERERPCGPARSRRSGWDAEATAAPSRRWSCCSTTVIPNAACPRRTPCASSVTPDPRAAAALATNSLRTGYALHPVRLLVALRAPESVPALVSTLHRLLTPGEPHWRVALACVEGLGSLEDSRARPVLEAALPHPRLGAAAEEALRQLPEG